MLLNCFNQDLEGAHTEETLRSLSSDRPAWTMVQLKDHHLVSTGLLLMVHLLGSGTLLVEAQNTNFSFSYFPTQDQNSFLMIEDVQYYAANYSFLMNARAAALLNSASSCARLLYSERVRMKDSASGAVASFHTAFTFQITGPNYYYDADGFLHGDGLAFTFASNSSFTPVQLQSGGKSLCLLDFANNGQPSNHLFAVEFDTFRNDDCNDSSNSHIGVDINSMNSTWSYNLCGGTVRNCSYLCNGGFFTAWIDYDAVSEKLQVFFANGSLDSNYISKPAKAFIEATLPLTELLDDFVFVGFSSSTGSLSEVHEIQSWSFTSTGMPEQVAVDSNSSSKRKTIGAVVGVCVGVAGAFLLAGFFLARHRRRKLYPRPDRFDLVDRNLVPRMFSYKELSKATKSFSRSELLGSGGFGAVYKGTLPSGALVAVKRMRHEGKHGEEGFQAEAASLSQIRHRNLVQLRGWCHEEEQLLLVYDYMCNGSLDEWLFRTSEVEALPLQLRHSILSGVAAALSYLHEECVQCVLHRDIKSSNVLLDGALNAYLGDFGLARLIDHGKMEKTTMMAGTLGYMAPEMPHTGKATKESDVYSFGVLVLEVMCGTRPLDGTAIERGEGILVDRVWRAHEAGCVLDVVDLRLGTFPPADAHWRSGAGIELHERENISISKDDVELLALDTATADTKLVTNLLHLGLLCCNPNPEYRPSMRLVSQLLQSPVNMEMSLPPLPICKPHAYYSMPGFPHLAIVPSSTSTSSLSTAPPSIEPANFQTSFATISSVLAGR